MYYLNNGDETLPSIPGVGDAVISSERDAKKNVAAVPVPPDKATAVRTGRGGSPQPLTINKATLTIKANTSYVSSVAFSPDGQRIVSGGGRDYTVKVWDARSGQETLTLKGHTDSVISVAFSPDGRWIASGGHDMSLKLWDISKYLPSGSEPSEKTPKPLQSLPHTSSRGRFD